MSIKLSALIVRTNKDIVLLRWLLIEMVIYNVISPHYIFAIIKDNLESTLLNTNFWHLEFRVKRIVLNIAHHWALPENIAILVKSINLDHQL